MGGKPPKTETTEAKEPKVKVETPASDNQKEKKEEKDKKDKKKDKKLKKEKKAMKDKAAKGIKPGKAGALAKMRMRFAKNTAKPKPADAKAPIKVLVKTEDDYEPVNRRKAKRGRKAKR